MHYVVINIGKATEHKNTEITQRKKVKVIRMITSGVNP